MIYWYRTNEGTRTAVILSTARKNMRIGVISAGRFAVKQVPITEQAYMTPVDMGKREKRKASATLRRLTKQKGITKRVREEVAAVLAA